MGGTITVYSFEGPQDKLYTGEWTTTNYQEAEDHARQYGYRIVANDYDWVGRYPVRDYTGDLEGE